MRYLILAATFLLLFSCFSLAQTPSENVTASSGDKSNNDVVVKTVEGLRFTVPEDMPIQKKDGIVAPMKSDEYVAMKFSNLENRLSAIEKAIAMINEDLFIIRKSLDSTKKPPALISDTKQDYLPSLKDLKE